MIRRRWDCELIEPGRRWDKERLLCESFNGKLHHGMNGAQAGISLLMVSPETQIVLFNESVPADTLSDLKARGYSFRTLAAPFGEKELRDSCSQQVRLSTHFEGYRVK